MNIVEYKKSLDELNDLAMQCYQNGDYIESIYIFNKILGINPYSKDVLYNIAKVSFDTQKYEYCITKLLELIDIDDEEDDDVFILLGDAYNKINKLSDAFMCYKRVSNSSLVEEKIKQILEKYKIEGDKLQKQYMDYPYPNVWENEGIPPLYFDLLKCDSQTRRRSVLHIQYCDINFLMSKYLKQYKDLKKIRVLNAGCGTGEGLITSAFMYPEVEYTAIDISQNSINIAKKHCQKLNVNNVKFYQKNIMELSPDDFGYFDIIISTGVLHHLPDPITGFKNIKNVLKEDGIIAGMVYGTIGRREVYDYRDIFEIMFSQAERIEDKINIAKGFLESSRDFQTIDRIKAFNDISYGEQGIVDLLLNAKETSYTTKELINLLYDIDLKTDLYHNDYLNPECSLYNIQSDEIINRFKLLDIESKNRIAEILNGSVYKHHFIAYKNTLDKKENLLFADNWIETFPMLWSGVYVKKDHNGTYVDLGYKTIGLITKVVLESNENKYPLSSEQTEFLLQCDGKKSIVEILENTKINITIPEIKKFLYDLNKLDVLFLFEQKQEYYNG